jgi:putative hemolysin
MNNAYSSLEPFIEEPVFIPESMYALKALELLRSSNSLAAFIVDEFGAIQGMVTLRDLLEEVVGELSTRGEPAEGEIVKASDGSHLADGMLDIDDFRNFFGIEQPLPLGDYHTLAGFILAILGSLPKTGELFRWGEWEFEIVDMDLNRIDKVRIRRAVDSSGSPSL